jgi:hypothetical protein
MSNSKRIGLKDDQGVRRLLENYLELPAESGEKRGRAVLCVQTAKKPPVSLTQNHPPKTGKVAV